MTPPRQPDTPEAIYGPLFDAVQLGGVFPDSKTFVDAVPKSAPEDILAAFTAAQGLPGFDLAAFIHNHFDLPAEAASAEWATVPDLHTHLHQLWAQLQRHPDTGHPGSSLLPLPHPYIVPGGRFREIYYWDSYFTMLGLVQSGEKELVRQMTDNFAHLISTYGHIPNGNRTYFLSRSQPPFFSAMVRLVASFDEERDTLLRYKDALAQEHDFWMDGVADVDEYPAAYRRFVRLTEHHFLNRYWDDLPIPRQESHAEDCHLAADHDNAPELFLNLRAACESGWDFSSRWLLDPDDLASIDTTSILPIDLNVLLWQLEKTLEAAMHHAGETAAAERYAALSNIRREALGRYLWDAASGRYLDYHWVLGQPLERPSMAMAFPLWAGMADKAAAAAVAGHLASNFLKPGGFVTTLHPSGQQWDAPNGWPPLQWVAVEGLRRYGFHDLAQQASTQWMGLNQRIFSRTGKMMEKYNVEDMALDAGGGEYPVQDGFGWTNGVYLAMHEAQKNE